ncbi:hypothetical protein FJY90_08180 [Candidatus Gottesmanbacteria bacterium]|nr:hypothetical protein [Candidatus Gottesmanbacteria bacterium]
MKKNALLLITLIAGYIFAWLVYSVVSFEGMMPRLNIKLINNLIRDLAKVSTPLPIISPGISQSGASEDSLARCLRDRNFVMYGLTECGSCNLQRGYFGRSFNLIRYIDCDKEQQLCELKNIRSYPIWEDEKGNIYKGAIPLEMLAQLSGCQYSK